MSLNFHCETCGELPEDVLLCMGCLNTEMEALRSSLALAKEALQEIAGETEDKGVIHKALEALEKLYSSSTAGEK